MKMIRRVYKRNVSIVSKGRRVRSAWSIGRMGEKVHPRASVYAKASSTPEKLWGSAGAPRLEVIMQNRGILKDLVVHVCTEMATRIMNGRKCVPHVLHYAFDVYDAKQDAMNAR